MLEGISYLRLSKMIDHSLLHPTFGDAVILNGCNIAREYHVAAVCVKPYAVSLASRCLENTDVAVCSVVGFPHGNSKITTKLKECEEAIEDGASEIDVVINIGKVKDGDWGYLEDEIGALNDMVLKNGAILKTIFETDFLEDAEVIELCNICSKSKVAYVKTSTGYGFVRQPNGFYTYAGATDHFINLMKMNCAPDVQIKAAGGIRQLDDLIHFMKLGVTRVGATATKEILDEAIDRGYQR